MDESSDGPVPPCAFQKLDPSVRPWLSLSDRQTLTAVLRLLQTLLRTLVSLFQIHRALALENLALRQQVALLKAAPRRPRPSAADRVFWAALARSWSDWRNALLVVTPDTVIRWHRE